MKIFYDSYIYKLQKAGGINRYFNELIRGLPKTCTPYFFPHFERGLLAPSHAQWSYFWIPQSLRWSPFLLNQRLKAVDLIHPTYYHLSSPLSWKTLSGKIVVTVHDFTIARFTDRFPRSAKFLKDQEAAIQRADYLICVSEATRADLLERFPATATRSCVIPLAASLLASPHQTLHVPPHDHDKMLELTTAPISGKYFLYVGARTFYKNFSKTLEAFALLQKKHKQLTLAIVGNVLNEEEKKQVAALGIVDALQMITFPTDELLGRLYKHCVALLYPSEYEGFGLPPLEAMTLGAPVIALKVSSLPEVVGKGGILLDPKQASAVQLAEAAEDLLISESRRDSLAQAALQQARHFSWKRTVEETVKIYKKIQ